MASRYSAFSRDFKKQLIDLIQLEVNRIVVSSEEPDYEVDVFDRRLLPYEVYQYLKSTGKLSGNLARALHRRGIPVCDMDIVVDPQGDGVTMDTFIAAFVRMFNNRIQPTGRTIMDFYVDSSKAFVFEVCDRYRNVFRCRIVKRSDYDLQRTGVFTRNSQEDVAEDAKIEKINIILQNEKTIPLPKGASVIDVAFAIHEELGYSVKSAIVNGHRSSVYKTLSDGDRVIIEADTARSDGVTSRFVYHARISWLNWVVTKKAKKMIINFLSNRYEGDDPRFENEAENRVVEEAADKILEEWRSA